MKTLKLLLLLGAFAMIGFTGCDKEDDDDVQEINPSEKGTFAIDLDHRAGTAALVFGNQYVTAMGDTVQFSMFQYYLSNIVLLNENGSSYTVPQDECYFLVKHEDDATREIELQNVPEGNYTAITFTIGVDSVRSASDITQRTGDLDPAGEAAGMYWTWNSGYIFVKTEGTSPNVPYDSTSMSRSFIYHIGGYGGYSSPTFNNLRTVTLTFPEVGKVRNDGSCEFHTLVDVMKMFNGTTNIDITTYPVVMFTNYSKNVSENYALGMFKADHIHND